MLYRQTLLRLDNERSAKARKFAFENAQASIRTVLNSAAYCMSGSCGIANARDWTDVCLDSRKHSPQRLLHPCRLDIRVPSASEDLEGGSKLPEVGSDRRRDLHRQLTQGFSGIKQAGRAPPVRWQFVR